MVGKKNGKIVLYPEYFDRDRSRKEGRKIQKKFAVHSPSVDDIMKAGKKLNLNPIIEGKGYPSSYKKSERILVDKKDKKTKILKEIARELKS